MRLYLKKLYGFLFASGYSESDYSELLSFSVSREKKVIPSLPRADIAKLLDAIDRNTVTRKRNYAIMLLGTSLGLRVCDVVALKLGSSANGSTGGLTATFLLQATDVRNDHTSCA